MHRDLSVTVHGVISCVHIFPGAPLPSPFDCGSLKHTIFPTPIIVASQRVIKFDNALGNSSPDQNLISFTMPVVKYVAWMVNLRPTH